MDNNTNSNTNSDVNSDYLCSRMTDSLIEVVNSYDTLPLTLKVYVLNEIMGICKQRVEVNIRDGFEKGEKKEA